MKKRLISSLLTLCLVLTLLPPAALAAGSMTPIAGVTLYKVNQRDPQSHPSVTIPDIWNNWNVPYRLSPGGPVQGEIPWGTVLAATASDGTWLKVKYGGRDCYVYQAKLSKVSQPDIVCSAWAKERLSYYNGYIGTKDVWPNAANDWTKPITRADMAEMLFLLFRNGGAPFEGDMPFYKAEHFTDIKFNQKIGGVNIGAAANFLASMGVIPSGGNFNAAASVTYEEFTEALLKLSAYSNKYLYDGNLGALSEADIQEFAVGGDTSAGAKITMEQARILCDANKCWTDEQYWLVRGTRQGATLMDPGVFVMDVSLGKYPNQPHVVIGADGKGELSNTRMQKFKVTYKKTVPAVDPKNASFTIPMKLFTIQTEGGKYLAIEGLPSNRSRLITRNAEFLWWITSRMNDLAKTATIKVPDFHDQYLNAAGRSSKDGTHIITWYSENKWRENSAPDYPHNAEFNFYMVRGVNSHTPTVATMLRHGRNLVSYPTKTTYRVGEGFDSTGFKLVYKDDNDGGKITELLDYGFYTSDGVKLTQGRPFQTAGIKLIEIKGDIGNGRLTLVARYFITVTGDSASQTVVKPPVSKKDELAKPRLLVGFRIEAFPPKTTFKIGENFDITGMKAVYNTLGLNRVDDKSTNITDKLTFRYSTDGVKFVELKQGRPIPFTSAGRKLIEIQYEGITKETYWITITK
ncbi:hypothetical protein SDC9_03959 [bioreactor metagenome]|uniref:SLH domain-containing protein n=1 Tax=bioreactor metagenome TaxID=1076179 RepID=A0A644SUV5_9ZZZZ|nr:hypothetical protein [Negativicutes bacterium]